MTRRSLFRCVAAVPLAALAACNPRIARPPQVEPTDAIDAAHRLRRDGVLRDAGYLANPDLMQAAILEAWK